MSTKDRSPANDATLAPRAALIIVFVLIGLNMRPAIAAIPPLLDEIKHDLGVSSAVAGLLTTIPVASMGLLAPAAHRLGARVGAHRMVLYSMLLLALGQFARLGGQTATVLYLSAFASGAGICGTSTMMASIVQRHMPGRLGLGTGIYSGGLSLGASAAALSAVPLAGWTGGWPEALASWALLALLAAIAFGVVLPYSRYDQPRSATTAKGRALPWRSGTAWLIALYLVMNGTMFYATLTWLAPTYRALGWSAELAGTLLGVFNLVQALSMFLMPALADRMRDPRPLLALCGITAGAGLLAIAIAPTALAWPAVIVGGFGSGGGFALTLTAIAHYGKAPGDAPRLSAMVFLMTYSVAAAGPPLLGVLRDHTHSDRLGFALLAGLGALQLAVVVLLRPGRRL